MKPSRLALVSLLVLAAGAGGWWLGRTTTPAPADASGSRRVLLYQSPMHPWITSEQPGKCTICGMDLTPVYEGEPGHEAAPGTVRLGASAVHVAGVSTTELREQPLVRTLRVAGVLEDDETRHRVLSAWVEGRIERLFVNHLGAEVLAGQPLAVIYSPTLFTAQREYLDLRARGDGDGPLLAAARERLLLLGLGAGQIDSLDPEAPPSPFTEILAPMSGTVVSRSVYEGGYVKEGDPLFEIADYARMWFLFDAYESDLAWLRPGLEVEVSVESRPGETFSAPIAFIDPTIDPRTRTARVRVELENPLEETARGTRRKLQHRLYAEGRIALESPVVLAAPRSAVLDTGTRAVAYVDLGEGAYEQRTLRLGRRGDTAIEIREGLRVGERVVTHGALILDGQAQLEGGIGGGGSHDHGHAAAPELRLAPAVLAELPPLVDAAARASAALAADRLEDYAGPRAELASVVAALAREHRPAGFESVAALAGELVDGPELKATRSAYEPFSTALADWLLAVRKQHPEAAVFHVFECPMTPVLGAGRWVQQDDDLRNPFFGSAMLTCGNEVP